MPPPTKFLMPAVLLTLMTFVASMVPVQAQRLPEGSKPKTDRPAMPTKFRFDDSPQTVVAQGTVWIPLVPTSGVSSWGPGAIVECKAERGNCLLTQFFLDPGRNTIETTYKISRWDAERVEAEDGRVDIPDKHLSDGYRHKLAVECLILDRKAQQVFVAEKREGQACRDINPGMEDGTLVKGDQLCGRSGASYDCPNSVRR
jgi:hypothetical protein